MRWTNAELLVLAKNYGKMPNNELKRHFPGRSVDAVRLAGKRYGYADDVGRWPEKDATFLKNNLNRKNKWIADQLGKSVFSVKSKRQRFFFTNSAKWC